MTRTGAVGLDVRIIDDGSELRGGLVDERLLKWLGSDITITGVGAEVYTFPVATDTLVGRISVDTLQNKTLTSPIVNTSITGDAILDQDDMADNSNTKVATQQSIKAYVNNEVESLTHEELADMPSADVADHDGRYYTETEIGSTDNGKGASLVGVEDAGGYFTAADAEAILQEIARQMTAANSPMIITGGEISEGTPGTFTIAALTAFLRSTDSVTGILVYKTLAEQANQAITLANTKYHVILTYGDPCTITISTSSANGNNQIGIGTVMKDDSDDVHFTNSGMRLQNGVAKLHKRAASLRAIELASGCAIAYQATREFTMTQGVVYEGINRFTPFVGGDNKFDSAVDKFTYCWRSSDVWQYTEDSTVIDDDHYDDNTADKGDIGVGRYGCHWVYIHPDDNHVYVVYGRGNYKLAEAEVALEPTLPDVISDFGLLIGKIIIQKDATEFAVVQMVTDTFFTGVSVADHNELANLQGGAADEYYHLTVAEVADVTANTTHRTSDGSDHGFIDQDVTESGTPTFVSVLVHTNALDTDAINVRCSLSTQYASIGYLNHEGTWMASIGYSDVNVNGYEQNVMFTETNNLDVVWGYGSGVKMRFDTSGNLTVVGNVTGANLNIADWDTAYTHSQVILGNPHSVTKAQVGLTNVSDDAQLKIASNLSDLNNIITARTNLGLGTAAVEDVGTGAGDIPQLDGSGKLVDNVIPILAISEYMGNFADLATALADAGVQASQRGDWFTVDTDGGFSYIVTTDNPTIAGDVTLIATPTDAVSSVNGKTGVVIINPDDLDDTATTNKFTTAAEITKLAGIATGADVTGDNPPQAHKNLHDPEDGSDALDTAAPSELAGVQAAGVGSSHSLARSDHQHQIQHSIADNHIVTMDDADVADNDYAKFTPDGLEGRSYSEVRSDIGLKIYKTFGAENPTDSEDFPGFHFTDVAITINKLVVVLKGTSPSVTWTMRHGTDRSAAGNEVVTGGTTTTNTTTGEVITTFNDATIPANSHIWIETTAASGTIDWISINLIAKLD